MHPSAAGPAQEQRPARALLLAEVLILLALSLGRSGVYAVVSLVAAATAPRRLATHSANLNSSRAPDRPWLDLSLQLLDLAFALAPVALAAYLLLRSGDGVRAAVARRPRRSGDLLRGAALAAGVGALGLAFYLVTHALGLDLTVVPESLPSVWWKVPVLVLSRAAERRARGVRRPRLRAAAAAPARAERLVGHRARPRCCAAATTSTRASAASSATW